MAIGTYCVAANLAIAAFPVNQWTMAQNARFVSVQKSLSIDSLANTVQRGPSLPYWAPAGQIFAMNNCSGLYLSTGNDLKDVPGQQLEHYTWKPVEQSSAFTHTIGFTFNRPVSDLTHPVPLMTYGRSTLVLESAGPGIAQLQIDNPGTSINWPSVIGYPFPVPNSELHQHFRITVTTDPNLKSLVVVWYGQNMINHYVAGDGPAVVKSTKVSAGSALPVVTVANVPIPRQGADVLVSELDSEPLTNCLSQEVGKYQRTHNSDPACPKGGSPVWSTNIRAFISMPCAGMPPSPRLPVSHRAISSCMPSERHPRMFSNSCDPVESPYAASTALMSALPTATRSPGL